MMMIIMYQMRRTITSRRRRPRITTSIVKQNNNHIRTRSLSWLLPQPHKQQQQCYFSNILDFHFHRRNDDTLRLLLNRTITTRTSISKQQQQYLGKENNTTRLIGTNKKSINQQQPSKKNLGVGIGQKMVGKKKVEYTIPDLQNMQQRIEIKLQQSTQSLLLLLDHRTTNSNSHDDRNKLQNVQQQQKPLQQQQSNRVVFMMKQRKNIVNDIIRYIRESTFTFQEQMKQQQRSHHHHDHDHDNNDKTKKKNTITNHNSHHPIRSNPNHHPMNYNIIQPYVTFQWLNQLYQKHSLFLLQSFITPQSSIVSHPSHNIHNNHDPPPNSDLTTATTTTTPPLFNPLTVLESMMMMKPYVLLFKTVVHHDPNNDIMQTLYDNNQEVPPDITTTTTTTNIKIKRIEFGQQLFTRIQEICGGHFHTISERLVHEKDLMDPSVVDVDLNAVVALPMKDDSLLFQEIFYQYMMICCKENQIEKGQELVHQLEQLHDQEKDIVAQQGQKQHFLQDQNHPPHTIYLFQPTDPMYSFLITSYKKRHLPDRAENILLHMINQRQIIPTTNQFTTVFKAWSTAAEKTTIISTNDTNHRQQQQQQQQQYGELVGSRTELLLVKKVEAYEKMKDYVRKQQTRHQHDNRNPAISIEYETAIKNIDLLLPSVLDLIQVMRFLLRSNHIERAIQIYQYLLFDTEPLPVSQHRIVIDACIELCTRLIGENHNNNNSNEHVQRSDDDHDNNNEKQCNSMENQNHSHDINRADLCFQAIQMLWNRIRQPKHTYTPFVLQLHSILTISYSQLPDIHKKHHVPVQLDQLLHQYVQGRTVPFYDSCIYESKFILYSKMTNNSGTHSETLLNEMIEQYDYFLTNNYVKTRGDTNYFMTEPFLVPPRPMSQYYNYVMQAYIRSGSSNNKNNNDDTGSSTSPTLQQHIKEDDGTNDNNNLDTATVILPVENNNHLQTQQEVERIYCKLLRDGEMRIEKVGYNDLMPTNNVIQTLLTFLERDHTLDAAIKGEEHLHQYIDFWRKYRTHQESRKANRMEHHRPLPFPVPLVPVIDVPLTDIYNMVLQLYQNAVCMNPDDDIAYNRATMFFQTMNEGEIPLFFVPVQQQQQVEEQKQQQQQPKIKSMYHKTTKNRPNDLKSKEKRDQTPVVQPNSTSYLLMINIIKLTRTINEQEKKKQLEHFEKGREQFLDV